MGLLNFGPKNAYEQTKAEALKLLNAGDPHSAFAIFQPVCSYPPALDGDKYFKDSLEVLAKIGERLAGPKFGEVARRAAKDPKNKTHLYNFGYELMEHKLASIAALVLSYAFAIAPSDVKILEEYIAALEQDRQHKAACMILKIQSGLVEQNFMLMYLFCFNSIMTGDLTESRTYLPKLLKLAGKDETCNQMANAIKGMLARADAIKTTSALDDHDLRGWHFVLNGAFLTHLSPYGLEEMRGRYAFVQDSNQLCHEGILRLQSVLKALKLTVPRVYFLADRPSQILASATASILELPLEAWDEGKKEPGLIVGYDLNALENEDMVSIYNHNPGQILWCHAQSWTAETFFTPDIVTFLYQINSDPWSGQLMAGEDGEMKESEPDNRTIEQIAEDILATEVDSEMLHDLNKLEAFAAQASTGEALDMIEAFRKEGYRALMRDGSPVVSAQFL